MKSSAPFAAAALLSCILAAGCAQTRETSATSPPESTYQIDSFEFRQSGNSQKIRGASVTADFFQSAKVAPLLGRSFLSEEYRSGRQQIVMLSKRFWQQQFGGNPQIIGTTVHLNGQAFTVIGIMPTMFDVPSGVDIWVPKAG